MKEFIVLVLTGFMLGSCFGDSENKNEKEVKIDESIIDEKVVEVDLNQFGYNVVLMTPDTVGKTLNINPTEMSVEVFVDNRFHVAVGYDGDLALKKEDIANDGLYKNEILSEDAGFIVYKSQLPDGSKEFYHYYGVKEVEGEFYEFYDVISDNALSEKAANKAVEYLKK